MSDLSAELIGAGAAFEAGNVPEAAEDLTKGIVGLARSDASDEKVEEQLAELDKAFKLPTGTLENIVDANSAVYSSTSSLGDQVKAGEQMEKAIEKALKKAHAKATPPPPPPVTWTPEF